MNDQAILEAMTRGLALYGSHLARTMDGQLHEHDNYVLCNPRLTSKAKNMVVPLTTLSLAEAQELASLAADFYDGPDRWAIWSIPDQPNFVAAGFERYSVINTAMTTGDREVVKVDEVPGLEFDEVVDDEGVRLFEQVREESRGAVFPEAPQPGEYLDGRVLAKSHRLWIGRLDGEPIATGMLFEADSVNLVKNIAVKPEVRGRGIGKVVSAFVTCQATATPVVDADDGGAPKFFTRLGFYEIGKIRFWKLPH